MFQCWSRTFLSFITTRDPVTAPARTACSGQRSLRCIPSMPEEKPGGCSASLCAGESDLIVHTVTSQIFTRVPATPLLLHQLLTIPPPSPTNHLSSFFYFYAIYYNSSVNSAFCSINWWFIIWCFQYFLLSVLWFYFFFLCFSVLQSHVITHMVSKQFVT